MELLRVEELRRDFRMGGEVIVHALNGVSFSVHEGEMLGLMGPSGSGKSTLLYLLGGLDRPTGGHIWMRGEDITTLDENALAEYRRHQVGFVFQTFNLIATMTALENVEFPMVFAGIPTHQRRERARHVLELVGLADRLHHRPTELSGGQQQRVAIARALVNNPTLILADEPTGNLDSRTGAEVMELLTRLNREQGHTIIIVSHDPNVTRHAGRCIHLLDGRITNET